MANLYFAEHSAPDTFVSGAELTISGPEGRHAVTVSRLRSGEQILIGDGAGRLADAEVTEIAGKAFTVRLGVVREEPVPAPKLTLVQALAKGDRDERAIETATEHGVDAVQPWQAERSVSRWNAEKRVKGVERWSSIVREAAKQSLRARVPEVLPPIDSRGLTDWAAEKTVLVLHPGATERLSAVPEAMLRGSSEIALVVGPEGGLSPAELDALAAAGARTVSLGDTVLRTSSAGPAALAVLNVRLDRW